MQEKIIDNDPQETQEWLEALDSVMAQEGVERAHYLLEQLIARARKSGAYLPYSANTAYLNTIPPSREGRAPGDPGQNVKVHTHGRCLHAGSRPTRPTGSIWAIPSVIGQVAGLQQ